MAKQRTHISVLPVLRVKEENECSQLGVVLILELQHPGRKPTKFTQTLRVNNATPAVLDPARHMAGESGQDFFPNIVYYSLQSLFLEKKNEIG